MHGETQPAALHTLADLHGGDHACFLFRTPAEHRAVLTAYMSQGLRQGEKVVTIVDETPPDVIVDYLRDAAGVDAAACLASGQLTILTCAETYLAGGTFSPQAMLARLSDETRRALAQGYPVLRITGEMTWLLHSSTAAQQLVEHEADLNQLVPTSACIALCQYDLGRFSPATLLDVLHTHPPGRARRAGLRQLLLHSARRTAAGQPGHGHAACTLG